MSIVEGTRIRKNLRFMLDPNPGTRYAVVCEQQMARYRTAEVDAGEPGEPQPWPGQPLLYMASCDGHYHAVAQRIITLLNTYGLVPNELDMAVSAGDLATLTAILKEPVG